jgi:hypothetical protein
MLRTLTVLIVGLALATPAWAQIDPPPTGLAELELTRSRECVDVLAGLEELDAELGPLAERSERLLAIAEAVALEDDRVVEMLDAADSIEAQVRDWFASDQELAQRYVATLAPAIVDERTAAREAIKKVVADALTAVQAEANEKIAATGNLPSRAAPCEGAIFVRSAVEEACTKVSGPVCEEAELAPSEVSRFRFVDTPEAVWQIQELRPWTDPTPLFATPQGQLDGARTVGYARNGNIVVTIAFSPQVTDKTELTPEEVTRLQATNDSLGIQFAHPDLAFTPALGIRATLPDPLGDESRYVLHFGDAGSADVLWSGAAGTGAPLEGAVRLGVAQVNKLRAGEPIRLTALRAPETGDEEAVFEIELPSANQARASQALFTYMTAQLGRDLASLVRPRGSE